VSEALGCVDLGGEVAGARIDGSKDAADGAPMRAALAALEAADKGGIYPQLLGDLFLCHPGPLSERAEGVPKDDLVLLGGRL
jgi:hypothetical protein